jgi:hypothetical protein
MSVAMKAAAGMEIGAAEDVAVAVAVDAVRSKSLESIWLPRCSEFDQEKKKFPSFFRHVVD